MKIKEFDCMCNGEWHSVLLLHILKFFAMPFGGAVTLFSMFLSV